jgi:hypothetical protein
MASFVITFTYSHYPFVRLLSPTALCKRGESGSKRGGEECKTFKQIDEIPGSVEQLAIATLKGAIMIEDLEREYQPVRQRVQDLRGYL